MEILQQVTKCFNMEILQQVTKCFNMEILQQVTKCFNMEILQQVTKCFNMEILQQVTKCFNMEILQQVTKYCGKEEKLLLRSNFTSFPQYFQYISNFRSQITYSFVKCGCSIYFFLTSNLISWGTDISKYVFQKVPWNLRWRESTVLFGYKKKKKKSTLF